MEDVDRSTNEVALEAVLDRLPLGVFLLDGRRVVFTNRSARAALGDGVAIDEEHLRATSPGAELEKLLVAAERDEPAAGRVAELEVIAFRAGSLLAVVVSSDELCENTEESRQALYRRLFGFTPTQARVAIEMTRGLGPKDIAANLGVGVETARTHVKHIMGKTGTHRQADAVRRLLTSPAVLGGLEA